MANRIYAQGRLTNALSRLNSLDFSDQVDKWIDEGSFSRLTDHCFLPCRDDEVGVSSEEDYFKSDINAINNSIGVAGYFDGQTFDSGCAFEVGYGYARGCAINLVTTDFFKYYPSDSSTPYNISKLMETIASIVHVVGPSPDPTIYRQQINQIIQDAFNELKSQLVVAYADGTSMRAPLTALEPQFDYYIDPNFNNTEGGRWLSVQILNAIAAKGKRFVMGQNTGDIMSDINNLRQSRQAIFYSDVYEPDVDSGILQGIAYGIGMKPIVYCSKLQRFHSGYADALLNGMIRYSASTIARTIKDLLDIINA